MLSIECANLIKPRKQLKLHELEIIRHINAHIWCEEKMPALFWCVFIRQAFGFDSETYGL